MTSHKFRAETRVKISDVSLFFFFFSFGVLNCPLCCSRKEHKVQLCPINEIIPTFVQDLKIQSHQQVEWDSWM